MQEGGGLYNNANYSNLTRETERKMGGRESEREGRRKGQKKRKIEKRGST